MPQTELQTGLDAAIPPVRPASGSARRRGRQHSGQRGRQHSGREGDETAAAAAAALSLVRRALIEGTPVTREALGREASFMLGSSPQEALRALDATAQRLGLASLL